MRGLLRLLLLFVLTAAPAVAEDTPAPAPGLSAVGAAPGSDAYADQRKRTALVISVGAYKHARPLKNPSADADLIARRLETIGFKLARVSNPGYAAMTAAIDAFVAESQGAYIATLYYAGHAVQIDGQNYLVPADFGAPGTDKTQGLYPLNDLLKRLGDAAKVRLILLDACRDNPFTETLRQSLGQRVAASGLAAIDLPVLDTSRLKDATYGLIAIYATQPTLQALDGKGANSPFAIALDQALSNAEEEISRLSQRVTGLVSIATGGRQQPEARMALTGPLYLVSHPKPLQCDVLAAEPDNNVAVAGVEFDALDTAAAEPACRADLARDPTNPRLLHNLARTLDKAGHKEEAIGLYRQAAALGYDWAQNNLGAELLSGVGEVADMKEGVEWLEKASEQGNPRARRDYTETDLGSLFESRKTISALQRALKASGAGGVPASGVMDTATLDAVAEFKRKKGLPGSGITLQVIVELGLVGTVFDPANWNP
jgi:uncharacterized caspase-like protein